MVNITRFSSDSFEEGKVFVPTYPDTKEPMEGVELWVKSSNSESALPVLTKITNKLASQQAHLQKTGKSNIDLSDSIKDEVQLACAVLITFKGFTDDEGRAIEATPEVIKDLMTKHAWLRQQVIEKANTETFFYKSA